MNLVIFFRYVKMIDIWIKHDTVYKKLSTLRSIPRSLFSPTRCLMAKLYFYYSAMNAGKSATLLQSNHNYRSNGMHTALFTPRLDNRYGQGKITSRIGLQADALTFDDTFDFLRHLQQEHATNPIHCILIDEAQFLSRTQVLQLSMVVDHLNIPCFVMDCALIFVANHLKVRIFYWHGRYPYGSNHLSFW